MIFTLNLAMLAVTCLGLSITMGPAPTMRMRIGSSVLLVAAALGVAANIIG